MPRGPLQGLCPLIWSFQGLEVGLGFGVQGSGPRASGYVGVGSEGLGF